MIIHVLVASAMTKHDCRLQRFIADDTICIHLLVKSLTFEYDKTHSDLVYAHEVSSHNRDEIVAKSGKQVKLRYLLELEKKEYYY